MRRQNALILMYHRVDNALCDPWGLTVSPENFEQQLDVLRRDWNVVPIDQLVEDVRQDKIQKRSIALTFDDGYRDNYENAAPLLKKYAIPATFYIATAGIDTTSQFWWDELQDIILLKDILPQYFSININNEVFNLDLGNETQLNTITKSEIQQWNSEQAPINKRTALYFELWKRLQPLEPAKRTAILATVKRWAGTPTNKSGAMMDWQQVQSLHANKLFSIGAHTVNHPALAAHTSEIQRKEINEGKMTLQKNTKAPVGGFAYPHGNYNHETLLILQDEGFDYAVTTEPKCCTYQSKQFELPRFQVRNWCGEVFEQNLKLWLVAG